jgi:4-carboxymuconolactone decarboxylase
MPGYMERLRRLAINDQRFLADVMGRDGGPSDARLPGSLDLRMTGLLQVAALVALDGPPSAFDCAVASALAAGATPDDVVDSVLAVGPTVGSSRVVSAAPKIALALGYDVAADLERLDPDPAPALG